jgi:hypothetical protein
MHNRFWVGAVAQPDGPDPTKSFPLAAWPPLLHILHKVLRVPLDAFLQAGPSVPTHFAQ